MALTLGAAADVIDVLTAARGALVQRAQVGVVVTWRFVGRPRIGRADQSGAVAGFLQVAVAYSRATHHSRLGSAAPLECSTATRFTRRAGIAIVATAAQIIQLTHARAVTSILATTLRRSRSTARSAGQQPIAGVRRSQVKLLNFDRNQRSIEGMHLVDLTNERHRTITTVA
jgi:hypothetical protein